MDYKPGEHPIADILVYRILTYGEEADMWIRQIRNETSPEKTYAWWEKEIGPTGDAELALRKARQRYDEVTAWETRKNPDATPAIYPIADYKKNNSDCTR